MNVLCAFCEEPVDTWEAQEVYIPQAVTSLGTIVKRLEWAHPACVSELEPETP